MAEAYPFLTAYANAHFPFGIAILLMSFSTYLRQGNTKFIMLVFGLLLSIILPFAYALGIIVICCDQIMVIIKKRSGNWKNIFIFIVGGTPYLVYQFWIIKAHPALSIWNMQNLTPSPTLFNTIMAFMPAIFVSIISIFYLYIRNKPPLLDLIIIWVVASMVLMYLPFNLQRRFSVGLFIPLSIISIYGLHWIFGNKLKIAYIFMLILSFPTNIIVLLTGLHATQTKDPCIYLTIPEYQAMSWLRNYANKDSVVLASPEMGIFIPGYTGLKVVYGHPFETIHAVEEREDLEHFYYGNIDVDSAKLYLTTKEVDYIMYGKRELSNNDLNILDDMPLIYDQNGIKIYLP